MMMTSFDYLKAMRKSREKKTLDSEKKVSRISDIFLKKKKTKLNII